MKMDDKAWTWIEAAWKAHLAACKVVVPRSSFEDAVAEIIQLAKNRRSADSLSEMACSLAEGALFRSLKDLLPTDLRKMELLAISGIQSADVRSVAKATQSKSFSDTVAYLLRLAELDHFLGEGLAAAKHSGVDLDGDFGEGA